MSLRRLLEDFEKSPTPKAAAQVEPDRSSEAYEAGYASGWDDATAAAVSERKKVDAEFARNIQDIGFTYAEAVSCVRGELSTFIEALLKQVLPASLPDLMVARVKETLTDVAEQSLDMPVELVCAPVSRDVLQEMLEAEGRADIELVEDENLTAHQVFLRFSERETLIDADALIDALKAQFGAMSESEEEVAVNG